MIKKILIFALMLIGNSFAQYILIPMDLTQKDHLKAYGVTYWTLNQGLTVEWLLNYRGGSFLIQNVEYIQQECQLRGVSFEQIGAVDVNTIYATIEENNMEKILLEKAPKIAVYTPPNTQPWDDAVTLALTYSEIEYDKIFDDEVLGGLLEKYDWLHLHHEDFTGQYGKFWVSFRNEPWYIQQQYEYENIAKKHGFAKVSQLKGAVAREIKKYVSSGGFLFAMCSATDALDIALSAENIDICDTPFDYDPPQQNFQEQLDFSKTLAFRDYKLYPNPTIYEFSTIDTPPSHLPRLRGAETDYFTLFDFSAKYDPVPTMLIQNHVNVIKGFMGQTTMFREENIKNSIVIMGKIQDTNEVKYIHGNSGKGTFTFYGGHDPEDYTHKVGDPPTDLKLHKNSPGYRLILNNILFPAAKKKKLKT